MIDPRSLSSSEMFGALEEPALAAIVAAGSARCLAAGTTIFAQGDPGLTCHSLLEGRVKIVQTRPDGGQSILRFIGPGEMYGTVAAMMNKPFPADAVAVVDSVEIVWSVAAMRRLMREWPEIGIGSTAFAGDRLFELQQRMGDLTGERVERRIARALRRLCQQAGRHTAEGIEIDFPLTRQDLAEMAGATLHTVSRTLAAWDHRGVTFSARRRVIIRDVEALAALAADGADA
ncbi:Crp/Fnr family transcriptional regulator [Brevundimonas sp.]|uniref:Crp/Fnr family transcriptional regulator n=1 Tax=Brevundimonas sp. TaxID=1871086 RepID=UPI002D62539A|nr:Crp/Fnr family transcriptional regulator [Brevundimonas sp.]HYC67321.1 Crp/Fnr family transcriptional regulator [Brevundimonas sp.]